MKKLCRVFIIHNYISYDFHFPHKCIDIYRKWVCSLNLIAITVHLNTYVSSHYCCQSRIRCWHFVCDFVSLRTLYTWSMNTCLGLRKALGFMSSLLAAPAPHCVTDRVYVAVLKAPALSRAINSDDLRITDLSPQNTFQPKNTFCLLFL